MNISVVNYSINHTINLSNQAYKCFNAKELAGFKAANFNWSGLLIINILLAIVILYNKEIDNALNLKKPINIKLKHIPLILTAPERITKDRILFKIKTSTKEIAMATLFILNVAILITNYLLI